MNGEKKVPLVGGSSLILGSQLEAEGVQKFHTIKIISQAVISDRKYSYTSLCMWQGHTVITSLATGRNTYSTGVMYVNLDW